MMCGILIDVHFTWLAKEKKPPLGGPFFKKIFSEVFVLNNLSDFTYSHRVYIDSLML